MQWRSKGNRFQLRQAYVGLSLPNQKIRAMRNLTTLDQWNTLWRLPESSSVQVPAPPRNTGLFTRDVTTLGLEDFIPLLTAQSRERNALTIGPQLEFIGPGSEYTNWILSQTPTK